MTYLAIWWSWLVTIQHLCSRVKVVEAYYTGCPLLLIEGSEWHSNVRIRSFIYYYAYLIILITHNGMNIEVSFPTFFRDPTDVVMLELDPSRIYFFVWYWIKP